MKKTLKLMTAAMTLMMAGGAIAPTTSASAHQRGQELMLVRNWIQRTRGEVAQSIEEDLSSSSFYTIRWGDTLGTIAEAMQLSVAEIALLNQIANPNMIIAGNVLRFDGLFPAFQSVVAEVAEPDMDIVVADVEDTTVNELAEEVTIDEYLAATEEVTIDEYLAANEEEDAPEVEYEAPVESELVVPEEELTWEAPLEEEVVPEIEVPEVEESIIEEAPIVEEPIIEEAPIVEEPIIEEETIEEVVEEAPITSGMDARTAFDAIVAEKGLTQAEIDGWSMIINNESGWNHTIANPTSGAYGLPQALPGNKMASHGDDWATNPYTQLSWMYDYMVNRYGSIQGAVNFWNANRWY